MIKIITIVGARPQFIKAAVVSRAFAGTEGVEEKIIHTGQHFDHNMSDIFFEEMQIPKPDFFLGINGLGHGAMTGQMLEKIEQVLLVEKPDKVLVYGDTNSTLAGALAASKLHIPVAHVEAGLRSFNMKMPEEINRILTDRVSDILFCPTEKAVDNLKKEGYSDYSCEIFNVGDVMYDAALFYEKIAVSNPHSSQASDYALCTIHRQENTDDKQKLTSIFKALHEIGNDISLVLPLHPRTKKYINKYKIPIETNKINIIEPVGYFEMIQLIKNASFVMTDSGGLQKEAYFFKKYCLTLRKETEWVELVDIGANFICDSNYETIISKFRFIKDKKFMQTQPLYGKGHAGRIIVDLLLNN